MEILIVDNHDSFTYNILELLRKINCSQVDVINYDHLNIEQVSRYDKILLSPGPGHVNDYPQLQLLLEKYQTKKSILGICLGHQALCAFFGARLINLSSVCHGQGLQIAVNNQSKLYQNLGNEINVGLYHSWVVEHAGFPQDLQITGRSKAGLIMSVSHSKYDLHGVQFHPESFITDHGMVIIRNFIYS